MESAESEGMKGNDYLLNALLFSGVETVDLWLQWNSPHRVNDMLYQCLYSFIFNKSFFGCKNTFFVEIKYMFGLLTFPDKEFIFRFGLS